MERRMSDDKNVLRNMRFKKPLFDRLVIEAKKENRTFNNLVETILINYFKNHPNETNKQGGKNE